tara:strand:- start:27 stop:521 length:495 start_codon:yes stop_codon:yes gene_type:complete
MTYELPLFTVAVQANDSDERYTPSWLVESLGVFDLDPCSPVSGPLHGKAAQWFSKHNDGLRQPWHGRVFMNPPFSNAAPWVDRFLQHANGIALLPVSNAKWRTKAMQSADLLWLPDDIKFVGLTHAQQRISMPVFVMALGSQNAARLHKLATSGKHPGVLLARP